MIPQAAPAITPAGLERVRRDMATRHPGTAAYRLVSSCHPTAGVDLVYTGGGVLLVWCHRCHRDVAALQVQHPRQEEA
jgi:hypothetical protein